VELVRNKPYNYALIIIFLLCCALIDGIILTLRTVNIGATREGSSIMSLESSEWAHILASPQD